MTVYSSNITLFPSFTSHCKPEKLSDHHAMTIRSKGILSSPLQSKTPRKKKLRNSHSHLLANEELKGQKGADKKKG